MREKGAGISKKTVSGSVLLRCCGIFLCFTAAVCCLSARLMARYITVSESGDSARAAAWGVSAEISAADVDIDADSAYQGGGYYTVTVSPGESEVTSEYGLTAVLTNAQHITAWPEGVTAKLTDADGNLIEENTTGVFSNVGTFVPGETESVTYRLFLKAAEYATGGVYSVEIAVTVEQAD